MLFATVLTSYIKWDSSRKVLYSYFSSCKSHLNSSCCEISEEQLQLADKLIHNFCELMEEYYGRILGYELSVLFYPTEEIFQRILLGYMCNVCHGVLLHIPQPVWQKHNYVLT